MSPHGTSIRYGNGCRCAPCREARCKYERVRRWHADNGRTYLVPLAGTRRRIQALMRIGWRASDLAARLGVVPEVVSNLSKPSVVNTSVRRITAQKFAALYDELCMIPGPSEQGAKRAAAKGWLPPLAWDDDTIDNPDAGPADLEPDPDAEPIVDEVLIQRALDGIKVDATRTERKIIIDRWRAAGRTIAELDRLQGWNAHRYRRRERAA